MVNPSLIEDCLGKFREATRRPLFHELVKSKEQRDEKEESWIQVCVFVRDIVLVLGGDYHSDIFAAAMKERILHITDSNKSNILLFRDHYTPSTSSSKMPLQSIPTCRWNKEDKFGD